MEDIEPIAGYPTKRAMLEDLYVNEGLAIKVIASRLELGTATIERWLRTLGIPIRSRGGANNSARISWLIHRLDPRYVFSVDDREIAAVVGCSQSIVYKYRRNITWNFVS